MLLPDSQKSSLLARVIKMQERKTGEREVQKEVPEIKKRIARFIASHVEPVDVKTSLHLWNGYKTVRPKGLGYSLNMVISPVLIECWIKDTETSQKVKVEMRCSSHPHYDPDLKCSRITIDLPVMPEIMVIDGSDVLIESKKHTTPEEPFIIGAYNPTFPMYTYLMGSKEIKVLNELLDNLEHPNTKVKGRKLYFMRETDLICGM